MLDSSLFVGFGHIALGAIAWQPAALLWNYRIYFSSLKEVEYFILLDACLHNFCNYKISRTKRQFTIFDEQRRDRVLMEEKSGKVLHHRRARACSFSTSRGFNVKSFSPWRNNRRRGKCFLFSRIKKIKNLSNERFLNYIT